MILHATSDTSVILSMLSYATTCGNTLPVITSVILSTCGTTQPVIPMLFFLHIYIIYTLPHVAIPCSKLTMLSPCIFHLLRQFILLIRFLILEESVIVLRRFQIHSNNIVSWLHGIALFILLRAGQKGKNPAIAYAPIYLSTCPWLTLYAHCQCN